MTAPPPVGARPLPRLIFGAPRGAAHRLLPLETPVALSFNGSTQAVMMATPADLVDFGRGFAVTEGFVQPAQIESVDVVAAAQGFDVQLWIAPEAAERMAARRRIMAGPVGCGLCGIDSLEQALRSITPVLAGGPVFSANTIMAAVEALPRQQTLHGATRAAHGAGWWDGTEFLLFREDVGRHNALDKLAGAMLTAGVDPRQGALVLTSRLSIDLVQKAATLGVAVLIALSAPTADAVALAEAAGLTLIALARPDGFEAYTHSDRILTEVPHVR